MSVGADLFEFALPTRIVFGTGALERLAKLPIPGKKTLLVTTSGGSLVRSGITTVEDAMDYLWRTGGRKKKADDGSVPASSAPAPTEPMETPKDDSTPSKTPSEKPLSPEEEERKRYFEDFMRSTFD